MKLWGGRFKDGLDETMEKFNSSIYFDIRLLPYDIQASIAHAAGLKKAGVLTEKEFNIIKTGLEEINNQGNIENIDYTVEDVHTLVEKLLIEKIGEIAKKLHTGRSRNDQVATDERLYLREQILSIIKLIDELINVLEECANKSKNIIMPGYTHLQRAQPITFSHHILAYVEMLKRDKSRLNDLKKRVNIMPLGSGAMAGTTFDIDRKYVASLLNFDDISYNSIDAVSDRDFIVEFLSVSSIIMMHLSRFCEEIVLWSTKEFNFVEIDEKYSTGSSIMPQKKNPDSAELIRGKTGRVYGSLISLLTVMKGLPLAYNKDMQEDKEPLFDTIDTLKNSLKVFKGMIETLHIKGENIQQAAKYGYMNATDLADYLVRKGLTFRDAHEVVGKIVSYAIEKNVPIEQLSIQEFKSFSNLIDDDIYEAIDLKNILKSRKTIGSAKWEGEV
ncbi:argininosuccinate lyase [Petrotoga sp. 9PWA.NaAc.5.4]|uniref:argininosuccinate lyase n=1 Tax=Petrotoga sp. 9PWA.NaAc.5.4 TaxID=1434328 RepID=UPI000CCB5453|nr:argininosuccinate lyase [Petrotoga sp. 9PWA.NaAc.5.4]PNR92778.1 argininosuccinate lyase [Petrotoga sp. 9PWA.NaAc.5.4]